MSEKEEITARFIVITVLISLFFSILFALGPFVVGAMHSVQIKKQEQKCLSDLKQIGLAMIMYADDNGGYLPSNADKLKPYMIDTPDIYTQETQKRIPFEEHIKLYEISSFDKDIGKLGGEDILAYRKFGNHPDSTIIINYADGAAKISTIAEQIESGQRFDKPLLEFKPE